jgi:predicted AAA+ superfamily ATPase
VEIDIPADIRAFIDEVVDSFVMWDLLIYCSKKIGETETPSHVAQLLGRPTEELNKPVQKLEKLGLVISAKRIDGEMTCQLNKKSSYFPSLQLFWAYNDSQENRLRILSYLLQKKVR